MNAKFIEADRSNIEMLVNFMREYYAYDRIAFDREAARSSLERLVNDPSLGRAWVIQYDGEAIGYCVLTLGYSLEYRGRDAFIDELFIREGHRGKGIGARALEFMKETARALGVTALHLEVERKNVNAQRLYRRAGFEDHDRYLMTNWITDKKYFA
jgi:GNAT superfamily N-acetyltransferase